MLKTIAQTLGVFLVAAGLASCGGGGDVAGDNSDFSLSPDKFTLKVGGNCAAEAAKAPPVVVTIIGGQPPYRIVNSAPEALLVDKTEATGKDPQFRVSYYKNSTVCVDPGVITVLDYHSNVVSFEYKLDISD